MKKAVPFVVAAAAAAVMAAGCAKEKSEATYESSKRYFDAWVSLNCPNAPTVGSVIILDDQPGTGAVVTDSTFLFVKYTSRTLDGTIDETTFTTVAQQTGAYDPTTYYGAEPWQLADDVLPVGVERAIKGSDLISDSSIEPMRIGGKRRFIVPVWLGGTTRYDKESDYLSNSNSSSNYIYDIEIVDATDDIIQWQLDSMERYSNLHFNGADTTEYGFYYIQEKAPVDSIEAESDTTVYINYIGRLLNGQVFDTNIADTAKMYHLYDSSNTYEPSECNWSSDYSEVTLGSDDDDSSSSSSVITGFAKAISRMGTYEKCIVMFYSEYGYSYSGSGTSIPAYAPLIFEIEFVDEPED